MVARSILRRAFSFAWVLGCIDVQGAKAEDGLIKFSINSSPEQASPGVDGSWPALAVLYGSAEQPVDCFLSFLNESMFVTQATCSEALSRNGTDADWSCINGFEPPRALDPDSEELRDIAQENATVRNLSEIVEIREVANRLPSTIAVQDSVINTTVALGELFSRPSNVTAAIPILHSLLSLPDLANSLFQDNAIDSRGFGLHTGSVDPFMEGSLVIGGYDQGRVLGNLSRFRNPGLDIQKITVGVEEGFLPIERLISLKGSFPRGPYSIDPLQLFGNPPTNSMASNVLLDPTTPHLHLTKEICDAFATLLELTYDKRRNIYLWNWPANHPVFNSPSYLEINLGPPTSRNPSGAVKIPFALLQPEFQITLLSENGTRTPPARYFPCSPITGDPSSENPVRLGRAFFQAAYVFAEYPPPYYWIGQAPGPVNLTENLETKQLIPEPPLNSTIVSNHTDSISSHAWTKSWSDALPIWTMDADDKDISEATSEKGNKRQTQLGLGIGLPIGGAALLGLILYFFLPLYKKSVATRRHGHEEIEKENQTAREIERLLLEKGDESAGDADIDGHEHMLNRASLPSDQAHDTISLHDQR